jgi:hypothetical protein
MLTDLTSNGMLSAISFPPNGAAEREAASLIGRQLPCTKPADSLRFPGVTATALCRPRSRDHAMGS